MFSIVADVEDSPDDCPRDRTEAESTGRNCLRKCKLDADCISARKRCLCDGLCGWSCVRPDTTPNDNTSHEGILLLVCQSVNASDFYVGRKSQIVYNEYWQR
ncbi:hypothetical protein CEXT_609671 [Caerostris extrusa]|uniref:WAP domain-containing protein n=1 Tax=Caerostris extrusa TaxID=172846 RepID=A0AAV4PQ87_CAEEX|nr:hypothetical protein CEXT_609671 [Caerostris extrusa]